MVLPARNLRDRAAACVPSGSASDRTTLIFGRGGTATMPPPGRWGDWGCVCRNCRTFSGNRAATTIAAQTPVGVGRDPNAFRDAV